VKVTLDYDMDAPLAAPVRAGMQGVVLAAPGLHAVWQLVQRMW
jgi:hypothetical protein